MDDKLGHNLKPGATNQYLPDEMLVNKGKIRPAVNGTGSEEMRSNLGTRA